MRTSELQSRVVLSEQGESGASGGGGKSYNIPCESVAQQIMEYSVISERWSTGGKDRNTTGAARIGQYFCGAEQSYLSSYWSVNKGHKEVQQGMG